MRASGAISSSPPGCVVLAIQPSAIVDTLRLVDELPASMRSAPGGSQRVTGTELNRLLAAAGPDEDVWNAGALLLLRRQRERRGG